MSVVIEDAVSRSQLGGGAEMSSDPWAETEDEETIRGRILLFFICWQPYMRKEQANFARLKG